jgi:hypothetical protein
LLVPDFPREISWARVKVQTAEVEEDVGLESFLVSVAEGFLDQKGVGP